MSAIFKEITILESGPHNPVKTTQHTAAFLVESKEAHNKNKQCLVDSKRKLHAFFCKGSHPTHISSVVTDHQQQLEIVKRGNICFNCLGHHKVSNCTTTLHYWKCQHKHHTRLEQQQKLLPMLHLVQPLMILKEIRYKQVLKAQNPLKRRYQPIFTAYEFFAHQMECFAF